MKHTLESVLGVLESMLERELEKMCIFSEESCFFSRALSRAFSRLLQIMHNSSFRVAVLAMSILPSDNAAMCSLLRITVLLSSVISD